MKYKKLVTWLARMTTLFAIATIAHSQQSPFPPCPGSHHSNWSNCVGNLNVGGGRIGVSITEVTRDLANSLGLSKVSGALVVEVEKGGPAESAGIAANDIVWMVNKKPIENVSDFSNTISATSPGENISIGVIKKGLFRELTLTVTKGGHTYVGEFRNGKYHGKGVQTYANGGNYVGQFIDGKSVGWGVFTFSDGRQYVGEFKDGKYHGSGIVYSKEKQISYSGRFEENKLIESKVLDPIRFAYVSQPVLGAQESLVATGAKNSESIKNQNLGSVVRGKVMQPEQQIVCNEALYPSIISNANTFVGAIKSMPPNAVVQPYGNWFALAGYVNLIGCPNKDFEEAKYWLELGVKHASISANHNLAWMYQNGLGVAKDEVKAATLYKKALDTDGLSPSVRRLTRENFELLSAEAIAKAGISETQATASPAPLAVTTPPRAAAPISAKPVETATAPTVASPKPTAERTQVAMSTGRRRALVIGNDTYQLIPKLVNAREDAKALSESLTSVGYQVTLKLDLTEKEMKAALRTFAAQVEGGDEVVVFFAGHGVQIGSANFLLPVDIAGDNEAQVKDEAIQLQRILDDMTERKARFTLAMIDACRDNPFKGTGRSIGGRGLASTTAATGQMVIFSAGAGQQALDKLSPADKSRNGLFTRIFLKEMQKPGVSVDKVVRNVRAEVVELAKSVGHEQVPAIYDQVVGEFYFKK